MRSEVIKILKNEEKKRDKVRYNELLKIYAAETNVRQIYYYQMGYTPAKMENLMYDMKNHFYIKDKDIALFKETDADRYQEDQDLQKTGAKDIDSLRIQQDINERNNLEAAQKKAEDTIEALKLRDNPDVLDALKFREEYPFLNDENTPMEIKALVTDKITAYKNYAAAHTKILEAEGNSDAEDKLFALGKLALEHHEVNQDIKKELDFYRDSEGRILGEHPTLVYLKVKQDVYDMNEADLVKGRVNAQKNIYRYEKENKSELLKKWQYRLDQIEKRLVEEFKYQFDKK